MATQMEDRKDIANIISDPEERECFLAVIDSFSSYGQQAYRKLHSRRQNFYALPTDHWQLLSRPPFSMLETFNTIEDGIACNESLAQAIVNASLEMFGLKNDPEIKLQWQNKATNLDHSKASTTIRQYFREWSEEGAVEREFSFRPVHDALEKWFPSQRSKVKVLLPGVGLGRLMYDLCMKGYSVESIDISYHALLAGNFILNQCDLPNAFKIYPWLLNFSNHISRKDQVASMTIPDIHPSADKSNDDERSEHVGEPGSMSCCAGDFSHVYRREKYHEAFDAVATVFFIDTAANFLRYIETVANCLKKGGIWINNGPLLWHYEDEQVKSTGTEGMDSMSEEKSSSSLSEAMGVRESGIVELTDEEVIELLGIYKFSIKEHSITKTPECGYIGNPESMLQHNYRLSKWVAVKDE